MKTPRRLIRAAIAVAITGTAVVVMALTALSTPWGRDRLVGFALRRINARLNGELSIERVEGTLFGRLRFDGVALRDAPGDNSVRVNTLELRYRMRDLLARRFVLRQVTVEQPDLNLARDRDGRLSVLDILPSRSGPPAADQPLVVLENVTIANGSLVLRSSAAADTTPTRAPPLLELTQIHFIVPYLRLSPTRPAVASRLAEVASGSATLGRPAVALRFLHATARQTDDTVTLDQLRLQAGETAVEAKGRVIMGSRDPEIDAFIAVDSLRSELLRAFYASLPPDWQASVRVEMHGSASSGYTLRADSILVVSTDRDGRIAGEAVARRAPDGSWTVDTVLLTLSEIDLEHARPWLDRLDLAGWIGGTVVGSGSLGHALLDADLSFRDRQAEGRPSSSMRVAGSLTYEEAGGGRFDRFTVRNAQFDLRSARRLYPDLPLQGQIVVRGTLDGPWRAPRFAGIVEHRDGGRSAGRLEGNATLDMRGERMAVQADARIDSVRPEALDLQGVSWPVDLVLAGRLGATGYLDSLALDAIVTDGAATVNADALLLVDSAGLTFPNVHAMFEGVDASRYAARSVPTRLGGELRASGSLGRGRAATLDATVRIDRSLLGALSLDSAWMDLATRDDLLRIDSLFVAASGLTLRGRGDLGVRAPREGSLHVLLDVDSLAALERLAGPLLARQEGDTASPARGAGALTVEVDATGSLESYEVLARMRAPAMAWGNTFAYGVASDLVLDSPSGRLRFATRVDSAFAGSMPVRQLQALAEGHTDSLRWHARSSIGPSGTWTGGGRLARHPGGLMAVFDSLVLRLPSGTWSTAAGATVVADSGGIAAGGLEITGPVGGRATLAGRWPFEGEGTVQAIAAGLPLGELASLTGQTAIDPQGELAGDFRFTGTARAPQMDVSFNITAASVRGVPLPRIEGRFAYREQRLGGQIDATHLGQPVASLIADLPIDLGMYPVERRRLDGSLSVRASADSLDLAILQALTPSVERPTGWLQARMDVAGTWDQPELTGSVTIDSGSAVLPDLGVRYGGVSAAISLHGDTIDIDRFEIRSGGRADMTGSIQVAELTRPVFDLHVTAQDFRVINLPDLLALSASGELRLQGDPDAAVLSGRGRLTRGVLFFSDLATKQIVSLEDTLYTRFVDTAAVRREQLSGESQTRFLDNLRIDTLVVDLGSDMWLRSTEGNIQLTGAVSAAKSGREYRVNGTLETPRGTYRLRLGPVATRDFAVTRGQVRYFGTPDLNADLDIDARHVVRSVNGEDVTVFVHIGGTVYKPTLTLTSDIQPAISDTEIISYLLFGAPSVQAFAGRGGLQRQQLFRHGVAQFADVLSGELEYSLITELGLPVDYLRIRPGDVGAGFTGTEIAIGKQLDVLGRSAFLTANPRLCPRQRLLSVRNLGVSLESRLSRNWLLAASVDPLRICEATTGRAPGRYELGLDLYWTKKY